MKNKIWISLSLICLAVMTTIAVDLDPEQVFRNPPEIAKPGVWWHWMGSNVSKEGITRDLEALKSAGYSSATIFGLADVCTPWAGEILNSPTAGLLAFTDPWWQLVRHAAAEGRRLDFDVGVHNCPGYESSGGPWITPELSMQEVIFSQTPVNGTARITLDLPQPTVDPRSTMQFPVFNPESGKVERPEIPSRKSFYRDIAMLALPADGPVRLEQIIDLTGHIEWEPPAGGWILYRFGYTTQGKLVQPSQWKAGGLECDKMSVAAVEFHMGHVLGDMKRNLGDLVGRGLRHVLFDSYEAGDPSWTPLMREEFKMRRGYDLTPFLATFAGRTVVTEAESKKFKSDFNRTIQDLYRDVYFATVGRMLREQGLRFVCEPYGGPWQVSEVAPYVDRVMTEFWTANEGFQGGAPGGIFNGAEGARHNILEAEAFTGSPEMSQWNEHPAWLKPIGDGAFLAGINRLVLHHSVHQPWDDKYRPGNAMGRWGTHFGRLQTWWEPGKAWVQYLGRCQALLQWGTPSPSDFTVASGLPLQALHRRGDNADLFFVVNPSNDGGEAHCIFDVQGCQPELWDPVTGSQRNLTDFTQEEDETAVMLDLAPAQSCFIVFRKKSEASSVKKQANFPVIVAEFDLPGAWNVSFDPRWGGPDQPVRFDILEDWSKRPEPGIRYYSGTAMYRKTFDAPAEIQPTALTRLDLGAIPHLASVRLNGSDLGVVWCAPWSVVLPAGLLRQEGNQLEIAVVNVWANRLIGDEQEPADCEWKPGDMPVGSYLKSFPEWFVKDQPRPSQGRYCFTTWNYFTKDSPLIPSGLLGPVRLVAEEWRSPAGKTKSGDGIRRRTSGTSQADFESHVIKSGLAKIVSISDEGVAHTGGGSDAAALFNGTTLNGAGGAGTLDDGQTFRGYGAGSSLTIKFAGPHDLSAIRSFAGHSGNRGTQSFTLLVAYASTPEHFVKLVTAEVRCAGGSSELRLPLQAANVTALRFEFENGAQGFNVYREINIIGVPTAKR